MIASLFCGHGVLPVQVGSNVSARNRKWLYAGPAVSDILCCYHSNSDCDDHHKCLHMHAQLQQGIKTSHQQEKEGQGGREKFYRVDGRWRPSDARSNDDWLSEGSFGLTGCCLLGRYIYVAQSAMSRREYWTRASFEYLQHDTFSYFTRGLLWLLTIYTVWVVYFIPWLFHMSVQSTHSVCLMNISMLRLSSYIHVTLSRLYSIFPVGTFIIGYSQINVTLLTWYLTY